jgi:hypothetical protein
MNGEMQPTPKGGITFRQVYYHGLLRERTLQRRAVEAAIWGMPIVSVDAMRQAFFRDARANYGDIVYWSKPADWRLRLPTPNASSYYVHFCFNTKDGPVVLEIPAAEGAGLFGSLLDAWQTPQADVGPAGDDQGRGGKYLLLPPGYRESIPAGHIPVRFSTYNGYSLLRAIPASSSYEDTVTTLSLVHKLRLYPLAHAANPPAQRHIDMAGRLYDGIARFDDTFYESLARMVNEEPVQTRDLVAMAQLSSLGIQKGTEFKPDSDTRATLREAIVEALARFMHSTTMGESYWPGSHWITPGGGIGSKTGFSYENSDHLAIDERGMVFFLCCAPPKRLGAATFYVFGMHDAKDQLLYGSNSYRAHIPPNVPAKQFWAMTVYDLETAAFIRDSARIELNSYDQKLQRNADGSVDVFFGPSAPDGEITNWIYTPPERPWFSAFRFYGPERAVFDKTWVLPDIEKVR